MDFDSNADLNGGEYTEGGGGVPPSIVTAAWMNSLTNEFRNIILAGGLTPALGTQNQTLTAINQLIAAAINALIGGAPGALDTLNELAAAINDDSDVYNTLLALIGGKANSVHGHVIDDVAGLSAALAAKATPADITAAINALIGGAPGALDTLNELAAAINDDNDVYNTLLGLIAAKAAIGHGHAVSDIATLQDQLTSLYPVVTKAGGWYRVVFPASDLKIMIGEVNVGDIGAHTAHTFTYPVAFSVAPFTMGVVKNNVSNPTFATGAIAQTGNNISLTQGTVLIQETGAAAQDVSAVLLAFGV